MTDNTNKPKLSAQQINEHRNSIVRLLRDNKIYEALALLKDFVDKCGNPTLYDEYNHFADSYRYLLDYLMRGFSDPDQSQQVRDIIDKLYTLTDKLTMELSAVNSNRLFYIRQSHRIADLSEAIKQYGDIIESIRFQKQSDSDANTLLPIYEARENIERDIFHYIWTVFPASIADIELVSQLIYGDTNVPTHMRSMAVGALLLSLLSFYDENKLMLLLSAYERLGNAPDKASQEIALRALTCFVIALFRHNRRTSTSQSLKHRIALASELPQFTADLQSIYLNLVKEKNAESLSRSIQDSIIPDIMKLAPDIIEDAMKNNGVIDISSLEENPEWKKVFDKSGLSKKIEEFGKLQNSGDDIFLSTFSHLKSFPFFKELYNWFRPYHTDNYYLARAFAKMEPSVKSLVSGSTYLCDNDKYSFVLSLSDLTGPQREMMLQQFDTRGDSMAEQKGEFDSSKLRDDIISNYTKDLYRFFTLYTRRSEFADIFQSNLELVNIEQLKGHFNSPDLLSALAETYFKAKDYNTAIIYYEHLAKTASNASPVILQKLGFAYQNRGNNEMALKNYLRYFLAAGTDIWTLKHIATCYRTMGQPENAIEYLKRALFIEPENVSVALALGNCLAETGSYDLAIKEYYKVDYLDTKRHSAWRPLAWYLFLVHDYSNSRKYHTLIMSEAEPSATDHLNFGHLCLVEDKIEEAVSHYRKAYSSLHNSIEEFAEKWREDTENLIQAGLTCNDTNLLLDAILMKIADPR